MTVAARSDPDEVTTDDGQIAVQDLPAGGTSPAPDPAALAAWLWAITIGAASLLASAIVRAAERAIDDVGAGARRPPIPRVAMGLLGGAGRAVAWVGSEVFGVIDPDGTRRASAKEATALAIDDAVPRVLGWVLDRADLTRLVIDHVDLDEVVRSLDIDAIAGRLPIDDLAERLDVERLAARVDLEALIERVDLAELSLRVIDQIDLPAIIRGSTEDLSGEALDALRSRTMNADQLLTRWRDRLASGRRNGTPRPRSET